jgi:hypothetical protein
MEYKEGKNFSAWSGQAGRRMHQFMSIMRNVFGVLPRLLKILFFLELKSNAEKPGNEFGFSAQGPVGFRRIEANLALRPGFTPFILPYRVVTGPSLLRTSIRRSFLSYQALSY